jgi:hypothetical protein
VREKTILSGRQRRGTAEQSAETQKRIDEIDRAILTNNYKTSDDYSKALSESDRRIQALREELQRIESTKEHGLVAGSVWEAQNNQTVKELRNKLEIAEMSKADIEQRKTLFDRQRAIANYDKFRADPYFSSIADKGSSSYLFDVGKSLSDADVSYTDNRNDTSQNRVAYFFDLIEKYPELKTKNVADVIGGNTALNNFVSDAKKQNWLEMDEDEQAMYNYLFEVYGAKKAEQYFDKIKVILDERGTVNDYKQQKEKYDSANFFEKIWMNIESVPQNILGGISSGLEDLASMAFGNEVNPYSPAHDFQNISLNTRSFTADEIGSWAGELGANTYQGIMSGVDSFVGAITLGQAGKSIQIAGKSINIINGYGVAMGLSTVSNQAKELYERGATTSQIAAGSIASGIIEGVFESLSAELLINNIGNVNSLKSLLKNFLIQGGIEASEEFNTEFANIVADSIVNGYGSANDQQALDYVNMGMSLDEARAKVGAENALALFWAAYSGFISGGMGTAVGGSVKLAVNKSETNQIYKDTGAALKKSGDVQSIIDFSKTLNDKNVSKVIKNNTTAENISDRNLGILYSTINNNIRNQINETKTFSELDNLVVKLTNSTNSTEVVDMVNRLAFYHLMTNPEVLENGIINGEADTPTETATEVEGGLPRVSAVAPEADAIKDLAYEERGLERLTDEQKLLKTIGESLGRKVSFKNLDTWVTDPKTGERTLQTPGGMYNRTTGEITLNNSPNAKESALRFILKHELAHFAEYDKNAYTMFMNSVMDSDSFKKWVKSQGYNSAVDMNEAYRKRYAESGLQDTEIFKDPKEGKLAAYKEMLADFVGDTLFKDDISRFRDALSNVEPSTLNKFKQWMLDIFAKLKKLFGKTGAKQQEFEAIAKLEKQFVEACKSAQKVWEQNHQPTSEQQKNSKEENEISPDAEGVTENADGKPETRQYSLPQEVEEEYMSAVERGDIEAQERLVKTAAERRGYTENVMHGTTAFGFTTADVTKSDDGISFFATDSVETASTYASTDRVRRIGESAHGLSNTEFSATLSEVKGEIDSWLEHCKTEYGIDVSDIGSELKAVLDEQLKAVENGKTISDAAFEVDDVIKTLTKTLQEKLNTQKLKPKKFLKSSVWHNFAYGDYYDFISSVQENIDKLFGTENGIYNFYANTDGLLVIDGNGSNWNAIESSDLPDIKAKENKAYRKIHKTWTTRNLAAYAKENGYKGVKLLNITDSGDGSSVKPATIYIFFDPKAQVKSADPITYDDNGDMIPLSERFNPQNDDIRWSLPDNKDELIRKLKDGQITEEQFAEAWDKKPSKENPASIANLKPEDAITTPPLKKKQGKKVGDSESKFYESSMKSSIFDNSFKNDIKDDSYIKTYQSITNKETLKKAADYLDENGQTAVNEWWAKSPDSVSLVDIATGLILMDRYQRVGDYESASAVAQKVRQMGTSAGQKVQIFSILGRFTPEGMAFYAQKTLDEAYKKLVDTKAKKWAEKNAEKFKLTQEEIDTIYRKTVLASSMPENSREKAILIAEISALIQNKIPPRISDSIKAWQRISMLLNFKTNIRNIVGNAGMVPVFIASDYFGTMIDKVIAKKTGVRTTGGFNLKSSGTAFAKGLYESWDDFKRDVHTRQEELNRFENEGFRGQEAPGKNFNANTNSKVWNKIAEKLNGIDRFTSFCLEAGDRTFFEMWLTNSLNNQMKLNGVTEPTPEMIDAATNEALQRTWQDVNKMSRFVSKFKQWANGANIGGYGLGDVVVKFTKTPANIAKAIVDFSPAGFILATKKMVDMKKAFEKGQLTPTMQNQAVKSMSNAITGTLIYLVVGALASAGVLKLSGDGDEDKDVSNFEKYIVGIPPYSMEIFGVNVTYDWMQPFGSTLAIVSEFMENRQDKSTGWVTDFANAFLAGGEIFTQQSFIKGLYDFFSNADENILYGVTSSLLSEPSVFIPQLLSQTASIIDPKRRSTYDSNQLIYSLNQLINKIPGLRTTLPEQVNVLGEDVENNQYGNPWTAFAAPYNTYPDSYGKVAEEVYALYKETGDKEVIPRVAPKSFSIKGHAYTFTTKEKNQFQRDMGEASAEMLDKLFKSNDYKKLTDSQKATAIKSIYSYSMKLAKFEVVKKDYDYDLISDIVGYKDKDKTVPILTRAKYNSLSKQGKIQLIEEEMFTKTELKFKNYDDAVKYYIEKAQ